MHPLWIRARTCPGRNTSFFHNILSGHILCVSDLGAHKMTMSLKQGF